MGLTCFQIVQIPDLSLNKYASLADSGVDGVLSRHRNFLRQWHGICRASDTSFHLFYVFLPEETVGNRLKLYFAIQGEDDLVEELVPLLMKSPLNDFYELIPSKLPSVSFSAGTTLIKMENSTPIFNRYSGNYDYVHYVPEWKMNSSCRLYDLFRMMETIGTVYDQKEPCAYRIDLFPVSMAEDTRKAFTPVMKDLQGDNGIQLVKNQNGSQRDHHAQSILQEYEEWLKKVESTPLFAVNMYAFAQNRLMAKVILNAAASEAVDEGDFNIKPIKADENGLFSVKSRLDKQPRVYCDCPEAALSQWATTYTLEEADPFFRFPALYEGENIELPKETKPVLSKDGIQLGKDENGYTVNFPVEDLPRHAFFTGMPGSGKTNTMLHLVSELKEKKIPFLVLEPAKKEYRTLLTKENMSDVYLFSPHLQSHFPLRMNPFEFPKGIRLSEHITAIMEVFQGSFVVEGNIYKFLSSSIQKAYAEKGWDIEEKNTGELEYPTLNDVQKYLKREVDASSYDAELKGNAKAFLEVRFGSLMERDAGELFYTPVSTISPEEWIKCSAIVELETLDEKAKNFFVLLVCHYILESLRADPMGGIDFKTNELMPVRHVLFIEEAHNIIAPNTDQANDSVDPKVAATQYIVKMLAEVRALREAIVIADQLPTALATEVTKNTGLKIVHRLTSQDDRQVIGTAINANGVQFEQMATFSKGKSLIYHERTLKPFIVQISEYTKSKADFSVSNDEALYARIKHRQSVYDAVLSALRTFVLKDLEEMREEITSFYHEKFRQINADTRSLELIQYDTSHLILERKCEKLLTRMERMSRLFEFEKLDESMNDYYQEICEEIKMMIETLKSMKIQLNQNRSFENV